METNRQPHLSSGWCYTSNLEFPRDSIAPPPKLSGATSQHQAVLWVSGGNMALIPATYCCLITHHLRKAVLLTVGTGRRENTGRRESKETGAPSLEWTFPTLY